VQVVLQPPTLGVAHVDDPHARGREVGELRCEPGVQRGVLEREACSERGVRNPLRRLGQTGRVAKLRDDLATTHDLGHRDVVANGWGLAAVSIDRAPAGPRKNDLQTRIA
jgi:hypothetical protein